MRLLLVLLLVGLYEVARHCFPQFQPSYWFVVGVYGTRVAAGVLPIVSISCVGLCWSQQCTHVNTVLLITMTSCDVTAVPGLHTVLELAVCPFGVYPRE